MGLFGREKVLDDVFKTLVVPAVIGFIGNRFEPLTLPLKEG
jgi:hypothetical protein